MPTCPGCSTAGTGSIATVTPSAGVAGVENKWIINTNPDKQDYDFNCIMLENGKKKSLNPLSDKPDLSIVRNIVLCWGCMFSLWLHWFSPGSPTFSHSPETCMWAQLETLVCRCVFDCGWLYLFVSIWSCDELATWAQEYAGVRKCIYILLVKRGSLNLI